MQTFLPFPDFVVSARILDGRRLNKQIIEGYQILTDRVPNPNHPVCLMWANHKPMLVTYLSAFLNEYFNRMGDHHSLEESILTYKCVQLKSVPKTPSWLGFPLFHLSHRVNLLRKNYEYYSKKIAPLFFSLDTYPEGYYWPVLPVGRKAISDREAWFEWMQHHIVQ